MGKQSIGEEVMQWAEKYWLIDKACNNELPQGGEQFAYDYFRKVFIEKINDEIKDRLFPENFQMESDHSGELIKKFDTPPDQ